ncbi:hypothetical protein [Pseudomonas sp.]|uniref:hypothetical protein n=1 Tax=Pseudomonas sp. TaxID=306 RepID=UPI0028A8906D|nr:hypothetical protein [Pseudomonas sp.]
MMSDDERKVLDALVAAWNLFTALPIEHADDSSDFRHHLHILQRQIMSRPSRRELNGTQPR